VTPFTFTRDGLTFHGVTAGTGDTLLLLHGGGSRASNFDAVIPLIANSFRVVAYDQRGFGATGARTNDAITHQAWAEDAIACLDHVGAESAYVCGWSLGSTVALNMTSQFPNRVKALALLGAPAPDRPINRALFQKRLDMIAAGATAADIVEQSFPTIAKGISPWTHANRPQAVEQVRQEQLGNAPSLAARLVDGYASRPPFAQFLPGVRCPVTLIVGADDTTCDVAGAKKLQAELPQAKLAVIPDCGHYYAVEQPEAVAKAIVASFSGHARV